jgi:ABC-2 type transport system permease protein
VSDARVHDVRFTRFEGEVEGEAGAVLSLARWSALRSMGAHRSWKVKLVPIALTLIAFAPAIVVLGLRALFSAQVDINPERALPYSAYAGMIGIIILLFAAVTTPELLCPDRRDRVLTLYFATALTRTQYVFGKVLAGVVPLLVVTLLPAWFLYAGNVVFAEHPVGYVQNHLLDLARITAGGFTIALFFGLTGLAIASLTSRRAWAVGGYLAFITIPTIIGGALQDGLEQPHLRLLAFAVAPIRAAESMYRDYNGDGVGGLAWGADTAAVIVVSLLVLVWRYRTVEL